MWDRQLTKHRYQRARLEIRFVGDVFLPLRAEIRSLSLPPLLPTQGAGGGAGSCEIQDWVLWPALRISILFDKDPVVTITKLE